MRIRNWIWRISSKLGFVVSSPSVNYAILLAFNIRLLQLDHDSLLNLDVDNTQDVFHVFFVDCKKGFAGDFFWLENLDVIFVSFLIGPLNQIFSVPFFGKFSAFLNCEKVFSAVEDSADLFIFEIFQEFWLFSILDIQFINFGFFDIVSCVGCDTQIFNFKMLSLF